MRLPIGLWRRARARALFFATSLTATPAGACPALSVAQLADRLPGSERFDYRSADLIPFLALWVEHGAADFPALPDAVALFRRPGQPFLVAFGQAGCLVALLPTNPADLWRALRLYVGPIA